METKPGETLGRSAALAWLVARIRQRTGRTMVAIDGVDGAGKTTFADELATELTDSGLTVIRISFDDFLNPAEIRHRRGRTSPDGFVADTYDYERFIDDVLDPLGCEGCGRYRAKSYDFASETPLNPPWQVAPDNAVVIVDGMFLHRNRLRLGADQCDKPDRRQCAAKKTGSGNLIPQQTDRYGQGASCLKFVISMCATAAFRPSRA